MSGVPAQRRRPPHEGSFYLSQIVGRRLKEARRLHGLSQEELADRMERLGHIWVRQTVSQVEKAERNLTVDELISVAVAVEASLAYLLSPAAPTNPLRREPVDIGGPDALNRRALTGLYGFNWNPTPQAWTYYTWPDMDLVVAKNWDEVLHEEPPPREDGE